jgi:hypothetical protein
MLHGKGITSYWLCLFFFFERLSDSETVEEHLQLSAREDLAWRDLFLKCLAANLRKLRYRKFRESFCAGSKKEKQTFFGWLD